jgi:esterase/lipase superfamily enzyme
LSLIGLALAGCAERARGIMQPVAATVPGTSQVNVVVATTRQPAATQAEMFNGERGDQLAFADVTISIPPPSARRIGSVQWPRSLPPNPATDFVTVRADMMSVAQARATFASRLAATSHRRVMVFVHGYNQRFEDAVYSFAQISHDAATPAVPVLFTWPSRGRLAAYGYDRESTNFSRDGLETVLDALVAHPGVTEIAILAHSMGNWLTLETLRQMAIRRGRVPAKILDVMLASADVDVDVFRTQIRTIGQHGQRFTMFVSRDDRALAVSRNVWQSSVRLGAIDPNSEPIREVLAQNNIKVIDLTSFQSTDALRHGKFAESPDVVRFIGARLAEGQDLNQTGHASSADRLGSVLTGAVSTVGATASTVLTAPLAIVDHASRESLSERIEDIGRRAGHTVSGAHH